jgi:hypothetical protein
MFFFSFASAQLVINVIVLQYNDTEFTLWDRFEVPGDMTLQELLDYFQVLMICKKSTSLNRKLSF